LPLLKFQPSYIETLVVTQTTLSYLERREPPNLTFFSLLHLIIESEIEAGFEFLKNAASYMQIMPLFSWFGPPELFLQSFFPIFMPNTVLYQIMLVFALLVTRWP